MSIESGRFRAPRSCLVVLCALLAAHGGPISLRPDAFELARETRAGIVPLGRRVGFPEYDSSYGIETN